MSLSPVYLLIWTKCLLNSLLASKIMSLVLWNSGWCIWRKWNSLPKLESNATVALTVEFHRTCYTCIIRTMSQVERIQWALLSQRAPGYPCCLRESPLEKLQMADWYEACWHTIQHFHGHSSKNLQSPDDFSTAAAKISGFWSILKSLEVIIHSFILLQRTTQFRHCGRVLHSLCTLTSQSSDLNSVGIVLFVVRRISAITGFLFGLFSL